MTGTGIASQIRQTIVPTWPIRDRRIPTNKGPVMPVTMIRTMMASVTTRKRSWGPIRPSLIQMVTALKMRRSWLLVPPPSMALIIRAIDAQKVGST
jgi:hypothetical protein